MIRFGNYFLVTNRHVVYSAEDGAGKKHLVDKLTFRVRAEEKATQKLIWIEMTMSQAELIQKRKYYLIRVLMSVLLIFVTR